uniref:Serotriflin-like n=1 Tax=Pelodiscus sinensis TaxID=13735 RepID=K7FZ77_PELSI
LPFSEMILLTAFLGLVAVLQQTTGQRPDFAALSTDKAEQQKEIVDTHNSIRRWVRPTASNMLKMEWNAAAAEFANSWANQCTFTSSLQDRRKPMGCGENLYMSNTPIPWSNAIQGWYKKVANFLYGAEQIVPGAAIDQYTQMILYKSYEIGCAVAYCPESKYNYFYVCHYCPVENIANLIKTPYKSGTPCGDCPDACDNGLCTNPCTYSDIYSNCPYLKIVFGCKHPTVKKSCQASCHCTTEIK